MRKYTKPYGYNSPNDEASRNLFLLPSALENIVEEQKPVFEVKPYDSDLREFLGCEP